MNKVRVLLVGRHEIVDEGTYANSSVILINSNDKKILVDAGSFADRKNLIDALDHEGLKPVDIDIVIVTHAHLDHTANLNLFKRADFIAKHSPQSNGVMLSGSNNIVKSISVDNMEVAEGVNTILTPGHIEAHISVVVETDNGVAVVCGDAIQTANQIDVSNKPKTVLNMKAFEESRKKILDIADYVIPGHGDIVQIAK